jgi:hypothetical protein
MDGQGYCRAVGLGQIYAVDMVASSNCPHAGGFDEPIEWNHNKELLSMPDDGGRKSPT